MNESCRYEYTFRWKHSKLKHETFKEHAFEIGKCGNIAGSEIISVVLSPSIRTMLDGHHVPYCNTCDTSLKRLPYYKGRNSTTQVFLKLVIYVAWL
jgi:hypothetical protein